MNQSSAPNLPKIELSSTSRVVTEGGPVGKHFFHLGFDKGVTIEKVYVGPKLKSPVKSPLPYAYVGDDGAFGRCTAKAFSQN